MPFPYALNYTPFDLPRDVVTVDYAKIVRGRFNINHAGVLGAYQDNPVDNLAFRLLNTGSSNVSVTRPDIWAFSSRSASLAAQPGLANARFISRTLSIRAALTEQLEAVVLSIELVSLNATQDTLSVTFDKAVGLKAYFRELNTSGVETGQLTLAVDGLPGGTNRTRSVVIPKQTGKYRIEVVTGSSAYSRDYNASAASSAVSSYSASSDAVLVNLYPQGVLDGRRAFAEAIYPLGDPDGFGSVAILAGATWDAPATRQSFRDTIANFNSISSSKTFLNALVARGAPSYIATNTTPSYFTGLAVSSAQAVLEAGGVAAYKAVYDAWGPFATSHPTYPGETSGSVLDNLKTAFVSEIQADSLSTATTNTYNAIYGAMRTQEIASGVPEGYSAFVTASIAQSTTGAALLAKHVYNAGAIKMAQGIFDTALGDGFDFRPITEETTALEVDAARTQYTGLASSHRTKLIGTARIGGLKYLYEQMRTQYGYTYDSTNTGALSDAAYLAYLEGLRGASLSFMFDQGGVSSYLDLYNQAGTDFGFTFGSGLTTTQLAALKTSFFTKVVSWSVVAALQEQYDLGAPTYFNAQTNYPTIRSPSTVTRAQYLNTLATQMRALKSDFYLRSYEWGAIVTYRRLYDLGIPFGFAYDNTQQLASYYGDLEDDYIEALQQGIGLRVTAFSEPDVSGRFKVTLNRASGLLIAYLDPSTKRVLRSDLILQPVLEHRTEVPFAEFPPNTGLQVVPIPLVTPLSIVLPVGVGW
jgi:hypothetical protein